MNQTVVNLKSFTSANLEEHFRELKLNEGLGRRVQSALYKEDLSHLPEHFEGFKKESWIKVLPTLKISHLECLSSEESPFDGFRKYLFRGEGSEKFEAVRIPLLHRPGDEKYIVCVSSQVGCAAGCVFCATGKMGFKRNLKVWEIVDQVVQIQRDSQHPIRGVVFMGMGEPFLNYENVIQAARIFSDPCGLGISAKAVTISTVGVVPMIKKFRQENLKNRLIVSLTSAIDSKRDELLPMNLNYPIASIMQELVSYQAKFKRRVGLAWTMMSGVNLDREEAKALASVTQGLKILIDLIPVNDATGRFLPPSEEEYRAFRSYLSEEVGCPIVRRYSGGSDIRAACGMLSTAGLS